MQELSSESLREDRLMEILADFILPQMLRHYGLEEPLEKEDNHE